MPEEEEVGPFFPSGMSAPEAALSGATEGMSDEDLAKLQEVESGTRSAADSE